MAGGSEIIFCVKNHVPYDSEITEDTLEDLMKPFLTTGTSRSTRNKPSTKQGDTKVTHNSTSTRAGLSHTHLACQGAGGSFNLKLDDAGRVVCIITMPAVLYTRSDASLDMIRRSDEQKLVASIENATPCMKFEMPECLKMLVIDDSSVGASI